MSKFINQDFLLHSKPAKRLYHDYAKDMPIIDFHSHLPPIQIADDARFENISKMWLGGDHYKWRAMRSNGIDEEFITGNAPDYDKFIAWARTIEKSIGNPLYHWTHLELQRYFDIDLVLNEKNAEAIWNKSNAIIANKEFSVRNILKKMKVRVVCTTDDPIDDLAQHIKYAKDRKAGKTGDDSVIMVPCFRPDKALSCEVPALWNEYVNKLGAVSGIEISSLSLLIDALDKRHDAFHELGCRLSDHALEKPVAVECTESQLDVYFKKLRKGETLEDNESAAFKTAVLAAVGRMNHKRGWTMQLHLGAIRNLNSRMFKKLGPDTGYDAVADEPIAKPLAKFLDMLERDGKLPKMIFYTLNPSWNSTLGTIMGCFQDSSAPGKIQMGAAWWFSDHIEGMTRQIVDLANLGLLSRFVGMLTDSRSFLSFPRHEYFRRLLCNIIGDWVERGEVPEDYDMLGEIVKDICYNNANRSFKIPGLE